MTGQTESRPMRTAFVAGATGLLGNHPIQRPVAETKAASC